MWYCPIDWIWRLFILVEERRRCNPSTEPHAAKTTTGRPTEAVNSGEVLVAERNGNGTCTRMPAEAGVRSMPSCRVSAKERQREPQLALNGNGSLPLSLSLSLSAQRLLWLLPLPFPTSDRCAAADCDCIWIRAPDSLLLGFWDAFPYKAYASGNSIPDWATIHADNRTTG